MATSMTLLGSVNLGSSSCGKLEEAKSAYVAIDRISSYIFEDATSVLVEATCAGIPYESRPITVTHNNKPIPVCMFLHLPVSQDHKIRFTIKEATEQRHEFGSGILELGDANSSDPTGTISVEIENPAGDVIGIVEVRLRTMKEQVHREGFKTHFVDLTERPHSWTVGDVIPKYNPDIFKGRQLVVTIYKVSRMRVAPRVCRLELTCEGRKVPLISKGHRLDILEQQVVDFDRSVSFPYSTGSRFLKCQLFDENAEGQALAEVEIDLQKIICFRQNVQVGSTKMHTIHAKEHLCLEVGEMYYRIQRLLEPVQEPQVLETDSDDEYRVGKI